jgi:hypothetical protein
VGLSPNTAKNSVYYLIVGSSFSSLEKAPQLGDYLVYRLGRDRKSVIEDGDSNWKVDGKYCYKHKVDNTARHHQLIRCPSPGKNWCFSRKRPTTTTSHAVYVAPFSAV